MNKARVIAIIALGMTLFDAFVNFSFAMMNTALDVGVFVIVVALVVVMHKSENEN